MSQSTISFQTTTEISDVEMQRAAHAFAQALAESTVYQAYEEAAEHLRQDQTAQQAILDFQNKQQSLQMMLMLNAVSSQEQAELERLREGFVNQPSVMAYLKAQEELNDLCKAAADVLSKSIGLSFTAACGPGCC